MQGETTQSLGVKVFWLNVLWSSIVLRPWDCLDGMNSWCDRFDVADSGGPHKQKVPGQNVDHSRSRV